MNDCLTCKMFAPVDSNEREETNCDKWLGLDKSCPLVPMRFVYADPPYVGQAKKHYSHDPNCAEVDHAELIERLNTYDGWALSASSPSLKIILPLCPDDVRVMAWVKPFCIFKPNVNPAYAWEPVLVRGGRKRGRDMPTVRDWCRCNITLKRGLCGVKPDDVCFWLFDVLNMQPQDEFDDLFPGSGAVSRAWEQYKANISIREIEEQANAGGERHE